MGKDTGRGEAVCFHISTAPWVPTQVRLDSHVHLIRRTLRGQAKRSNSGCGCQSHSFSLPTNAYLGSHHGMNLKQHDCKEKVLIGQNIEITWLMIARSKRRLCSEEVTECRRRSWLYVVVVKYLRSSFSWTDVNPKAPSAHLQIIFGATRWMFLLSDQWLRYLCYNMSAVSVDFAGGVDLKRRRQSKATYKAKRETSYFSIPATFWPYLNLLIDQLTSSVLSPQSIVFSGRPRKLCPGPDLSLPRFTHLTTQQLLIFQ